MIDSRLSTGMPTLDRVFRGLLPGDNLVWQVDAIEDFAPFAGPYCRAAQQAGRRLVYFRFAKHPPLASEHDGATVCQLPSCESFEKFITQIRRTIREAGRGAFFLFDCLSELADEWYSDRMLGNFFMLTCPYVYDLESLAYFPLLRSMHSLQATAPIARTTQHFFNDLVEWDMLYLALFPRKKGNGWNREFFENAPNRLADLMPDAARWQEVIRVIDFPKAQASDPALKLAANSLEQKVVCYLDRNVAPSQSFAVDERRS